MGIPTLNGFGALLHLSMLTAFWIFVWWLVATAVESAKGKDEEL